MNIDNKTWLTHPGPSVPEWWAPVMAREQAEREAELKTERGEKMRRERNEAVLRVMRERGK
jgi:hypothetical protein